MHYHAEVWVPNLYNLSAQIAVLMEPHKEGEQEGGFWDWYQIGGRYTGAHDPNYSPEKNPENVETCNQCDGTGFRNDDLGRTTREKTPTYTCNGCGTFVDGKGWTHGEYGPGRKLKWPTQWRRVEIDVTPVSAASEELTAYTLMAAGRVLHKEVWDGKEWKDTDFDGKVKPVLEKLGVKDGYLVTVDYHS